MRTTTLLLLLLAGCSAIVMGMVLHVTPRAIPAQSSPAAVRVEADVKKLKRGKTYDMRVTVDLTGVNVPQATQAAAIVSYIIPISFDRNDVEFISADGGDNPVFSAGPISVTNAQKANESGLVTLVGAQTTSDGFTGLADVANLRFRVIAPESGKTSLAVNPELAAPGLSLASTARSTTPGEPYRIPANGQSSSFKIKRCLRALEERFSLSGLRRG